MNRLAAGFDEDFLDRHAEAGGGVDESLLDSPAVIDASTRIAGIYARLLGDGMDEAAVGAAMIGATVMLYKSIGLGAPLPSILRRVADRLDRERRAH